LAVSPVMLLVKVPVPDPSVVLELEVVGLVLVLQHIPLAVTDAFPSEVTFPPPEAVVVEVAEGLEVITVGATGFGGVVKVRSEPYPVPAEFVAYALT